MVGAKWSIVLAQAAGHAIVVDDDPSPDEYLNRFRYAMRSATSRCMRSSIAFSSGDQA